ncbi:transcriptional regulator [Streptomyces rhizosphaerihabitans]|uniref:transcriptional regulator n=1 Tax=Streptomyces rhizosphaerihabitans TaxID=1266770 RepID=UPI0021BF9BE9|nr:transcriptional regulator [Streptomyces rhizosphaerihabitans]MCT9005866.1 transcriptional regulator [Streptomyces rhizosphaerihabitans]
MTPTAREVLEDITGKLAPDPHANRLLPLIARGAAQRTTLAALALEQRHVIAADHRAFLHLAERSAAGTGTSAADPASAAFFEMLAEGEALAGDRLAAFATAVGADEARAAAYEPLADCQAYPAYVAWLALNGEPIDVVLALGADFAAWGGYCETIAEALRRHYGFDDEACGFFDLFAAPAPELENRALAAVQAGLDTGRISPDDVHRHGRLLQAYEAKFWHALWELDQRVV